MTVAFSSLTTSGSGAAISSPRNISLPSVSAGDVLVIGSATSYARPQTTPSGFTRYDAEQTFTNGGTTEGRFDVYWRVCDGTEGSTVSLAWTGGTAAHYFAVALFTGAHQTTPVQAVSWTVTSTAGHTEAAVADVTATSAPTVGLLFVAMRPNSTSGTTVTAPDGNWTERGDNAFASTIINVATYTRTYSSTGAQTCPTAAFSNTAPAYCTAHVIVQAPPAAPALYRRPSAGLLGR